MPAPLGYGAELSLRLGFEDFTDVPVTVTLDASAVLNTPVNKIDPTIVVEAVKSWAAVHGSSQGFVSVQPPDSLARRPEFAVSMRQIASWTASRRFLQAIGWATFLGPDLCSRLGGAAEVVSQAPCWRSETVGQGVFLQATRSPDDELLPEMCATLAGYLQPLLPTQSDRIPPTRPARRTAPRLTLDTITSRTGPLTERWKPSFTIGVIEREAPQVEVEIWFRSRPAVSVRETIAAVFGAWCRYDLSLNDLAESCNPTAVQAIGRSIRWSAMLGRPDPPSAASKLANRLEAFARLMAAPIERIYLALPEQSSAPRAGGRRRRKSRSRLSFTIDIVDQSGVDATFNLYFKSPPTPEQQNALRIVLRTWYEHGFNGGYGGAGFHDMRGPVFNGLAARWHVDLGLADGHQAVAGLGRRLEEFSRQAPAAIDRLVVGEELVE